MDEIKKAFNYVVAALVFILAGAAYMFKTGRDKALSRVGQLEADKKLGEVLSKKEEAVKDAFEQEMEYRRLRNEFNDDDNGPSGAA